MVKFAIGALISACVLFAPVADVSAAERKTATSTKKYKKVARKQLDVLSNKLRDKLGDPSASDDEVSRLVDQVSAQEAVIRKARLVAWVRARRVLDPQQQTKIQDAARKKSK